MRFVIVAASAAAVAVQANQAALYEAFLIYDQLLETTVPFGQYNGSVSGHCAANACLGASCYDWAIVDGLDSSIKSVAGATRGAVLEEAWEALVGGEDVETVVASLNATIESGDLVDFYQTLETFACCDCEGCMRLANCYQKLPLPPLEDVSCATVWEFLLETTFTEAALIESLNELNLGGCFYCPALLGELEDTAIEVLVGAGLYDFRSWTETTTTGSFASTTTNIQPTTTLDAHCGVDVECEEDYTEAGAVVCSCKITCEVDGNCCPGHSDVCDESCPAESYQVNRDAADTYYYDLDAQTKYDRYSCDDIVNLFGLSDDERRFSCYDLEVLYGLNCDGCFCAEPVDATTTVAPACSNSNAECGFGWVEPLSCDELIRHSRETIEANIDDELLQSSLTCAGLEDLGCNCEGCGCERETVCAGIVDGEVLCMGGYSCDFWVQRLPGVTCETLEDEYGCNCNYCECDPTVPSSTPEPECRCEVEYEMDWLNGDLQTVTCDSLSESLSDAGGLCCGVMEYAFQMDCTGCCCETELCETCTDNTTTVAVTTTTTPVCPGYDTTYILCDFDYECRESQAIPTTDQFSVVYDCAWIDNFLANRDGVCAKIGNRACTTDAGCSNKQVCNDGFCSICIDLIPGERVASGTAQPCVYPNHVDANGNEVYYTAYDCADDHNDFVDNGSGEGCIYINNDPTAQAASFCRITLSSVACPDVPEPCNTECRPSWITVSSCSATCGRGTRDAVYTCLDEQDGIDCRMDESPTNCVSQGITQVGREGSSPCNTVSCDQSPCENDRVGDGACDATDEADYSSFYNDADVDEAFVYNVAVCDWDGGDCCAPTCAIGDNTASATFNGFTRGQVCSVLGGSCASVPAASRVAAEELVDELNPGGHLSTDLECVNNGDGTFNCCVDMVVFGTAAIGSTCSYDPLFNCVDLSGFCEDPEHAVQ